MAEDPAPPEENEIQTEVQKAIREGRSITIITPKEDGSRTIQSTLSEDNPFADLINEDGTLANDARLHQRLKELCPGEYQIIKEEHEREQIFEENVNAAVAARAIQGASLLGFIEAEEARRAAGTTQTLVTQSAASKILHHNAELKEITSAEMSAKTLDEPGVIGPLPADWKGDDGNPNFKTLGTLSPPIMRKIEPVGPHFLAYARRKRHGRTFSEDERIEALSKVKKTEDDEATLEVEPEDPLMLARDAKDWKGQDHYAVLGLSKYRYRATEAQIKAAYRQKSLKHHPDKKSAERARTAQAGTGDDGASDDSFFKCIQKAVEILQDPKKRRQFDSVDSEADVAPPSKKETQKPSAFYKKWNAVFESEARFSNKKPVPNLGNEKSTEDEVKEFYDFWYDFDSWRTFEYLDEDVPDDNEGRDHKRHVEKKNSNARRKHKSEDIARLRKVVDDCLASDERIKKFRQQNSANKNKKRLDKEAAAKKEAEEKQKVKEAEEAQKKADEEAAKIAKDQSKKEKEAAKTAVKKNKRVVKKSVQDVNYFVAAGTASPEQVNGVLDDTERVIGKSEPEDLAALVSKLNLAGKDVTKVKEALVGAAEGLVGAGKAKEGEFKIFK